MKYEVPIEVNVFCEFISAFEQVKVPFRKLLNIIHLSLKVCWDDMCTVFNIFL